MCVKFLYENLNSGPYLPHSTPQAFILVEWSAVVLNDIRWGVLEKFLVTFYFTIRLVQHKILLNEFCV